MGKLILIRHGQASADSDDYDQLSDLGAQQATLLGTHWAIYHPPPDKVYVGSLRRHHQTLDATEAAFRRHAPEGMDWPERTEDPAFNEYDAMILLQTVVPHLLEQDPELQAQVEAAAAKGKSIMAGGTFWQIFTKVTRMWVNDEIQAPDVPRWTDFTQTVEAGLQNAMAHSQKGERIAIFTSGGPIAVATGLSLGLDATQMLELSWRIYNASLTQFLFSQGRYSLNQFNTLSHLPHSADQTLR